MEGAERERYSRQILFKGIGEAGQERLRQARAVVVGCGALGSTIANSLVRAGVGHVVVADRDRVELSNLQRQNLFDEGDLGAPKALAAAAKLRRINATVTVEARAEAVHAGNIEALIAGAGVVVDGTDNFATRYLINDACLKGGIPWVYGGVVAARGMSLTVRPGAGPCLRCLFPEPQPPGAAVTCHTDGIVGAIVNVIGSIEALEAIKLLTGSGRLNGGLLTVDLWEHRYEVIPLPGRTPGCPACDRGIYDFLNAAESAGTTPC